MPSSSSHKAIYRPAGAALEYSHWGCNLYVGSSHRGSYCYNCCGVFKHILGGSTPTLKKSLGTPEQAYSIFCKELTANLPSLQTDGLFFSFSTDPMLPETIDLTLRCALHALCHDVPVQILTKTTDWIFDTEALANLYPYRHLLRFGFTFTGYDDRESGAPTNSHRQVALIYLHRSGFHTFASMEPVIDFGKSLAIIYTIASNCEEFRIGLLSPSSRNRYNWHACDRFIRAINDLAARHHFALLYKESIRRFYTEAAPAGVECSAILSPSFPASSLSSSFVGDAVAAHTSQPSHNSYPSHEQA